MIIQYFVLHFILVAMENTCTVSKIPEKDFMSSEKQSKNLPTDENIFETIERSSCDTETTPVSSQHKKKRKQTTSHEETTKVSARLRSKRSRLS